LQQAKKSTFKLGNRLLSRAHPKLLLLLLNHHFFKVADARFFCACFTYFCFSDED